MALEDAIGRVPQHPADQLDALFGCLSRAMPTLPSRPNFMQEMLGLEVTEVSPLVKASCQAQQALGTISFIFLQDLRHRLPRLLWW